MKPCYLIKLYFLEPNNGDNYTYTIGVDAKSAFLFCNVEDSSIQLSNIYWRRNNRIGFYSNPLDVYLSRNILMHTNSQEMECFDTVSGGNIMSMGLLIQGLLFRSGRVRVFA